MKQQNTSRHLENQAIEWLVKLNNPQLTKEDEQAFLQWLNQSPEHQSAYIKAEDLWSISSKAISLDVKPAQFTWHYALASVLLLICCSYFYLGFTKTESQEFYTGIGEQKEIQLADGSSVKLNNQTHIQFVMDRHGRKINLLKGEALFRVQPDKAKPFDIETDDGVVRVVGTYFSVNRYEASTTVTVIEGRVALGKKVDSIEKFIAAQVLSASQQQTMADAFAGKQPQTVNPQTELSWKENRLIYKSAMLTEVIRDLERIYPVTIRLADPALGQRQVTAVIKLSSIDQVIKVLEASLALHAEQDGAVITLFAKK